MHLTLRASQAKGKWSLLNRRNATFIRALLKSLSQRYKVRVFEFANVGNHLHLLVQAKDLRGFQSFLRLFSGQIAVEVTGSGKTRPLEKRFWDLPAFTRLVAWGRDFKRVVEYIIQNRLEAAGVIAYQPRRTRAKPP